MNATIDQSHTLPRTHRAELKPLTVKERRTLWNKRALTYFRISVFVAWFCTDVIGGYLGTLALLTMVEYGLGMPLASDEATRWLIKAVIFSIIFLVGTSGQFLLTQFWGWFWEDKVHRLLPALTWAMISTSFQVAIATIGFYDIFYPFNPNNIVEPLMAVMVALAIIGSIGAQQVVHVVALTQFEGEK